MRTKRKLIKYNTFIEIVELSNKGVPFTKLVRQYNLDMSSQHLSRLIKQYNILKEREQQFNPHWLKSEGEVVQEQPSDVLYKGLFPWGQWVYNL